MKYQNEYLKRSESSKVNDWITGNLASYVKKNNEDCGEIEHIIDFLNSSKCPRRIQFMSYDEAKSGADRWTKTLIKKAGDIIETDADVEVFKDFKDGFKCVKLVGEAAFQREGKLMSHCVGSYYGKKDMTILSLRDSKNNPHCTIEVAGEKDNIQQIKGKGNGSIHPSYINYVLQILKKLDCDVRSSELGNLGYLKLSDETWVIIEKNIKKPQYIMFNNVKYFYKYSKVS